jgi:hypothetical protein
LLSYFILCSQIWPNPCMDDLPQKLTLQFGSRSTIWGTILHGYRSRWTRLLSGTRSRSVSKMPRFATSWITSTQLLPSSMPHPSHLFSQDVVSHLRVVILHSIVQQTGQELLHHLQTPIVQNGTTTTFASTALHARLGSFRT